METSLFLAARSGLFPASLVQGIPARFAGGTYKSREVRLDGIPEVHLAPLAGTGLAGLRVSYVAPGDNEPVVVSSAFAEVIRKALSAARYDDTVLMLGETVTGKTLTARRIHEAGSRVAGPFVEVNCSAIPESMAESELFGHVRGAFTGAASPPGWKIQGCPGWHHVPG